VLWSIVVIVPLGLFFTDIGFQPTGTVAYVLLYVHYLLFLFRASPTIYYLFIGKYNIILVVQILSEFLYIFRDDVMKLLPQFHSLPVLALRYEFNDKSCQLSAAF